MSDVAQESRKGCVLTVPRVTTLTFPDGSQCLVAGLNEIFSDMHDRGTPVGLPTARKIVKKVAVTRCIDESFRQQYFHILEEYRKYFDARVYAEQADDPAQCVHDDLGLAGVLWKLLFMVFRSSHPWPPLVRQKQRQEANNNAQN